MNVETIKYQLGRAQDAALQAGSEPCKDAVRSARAAFTVAQKYQGLTENVSMVQTVCESKQTFDAEEVNSVPFLFILDQLVIS